MAANTRRLVALDDQQIIELMSEVATLGGAQFTLQAFGADLGSFQDIDQVKAAYPDIKWDGTRSISHARANMQSGGRLEYWPTVTQFDPNGQPTSSAASEWEAEVSIMSSSQGGPSPSETIAIARIVDKAAQRAGTPVMRSMSADGYGKVLTKNLAGLAALNEQLVRETAETRRDQQAELDEMRRRLRDETEAERAALKDIHAGELDRVRSREAELERRQTELDNRGHMHARRELRTNITADLKQRLGADSVGRTTAATRKSIFLGGAILAAAAGVFAGVALWEFFQLVQQRTAGANLVTYFVMGRAALGTAGIFGIGFYLLGWAKQLHDSDLRTDRGLERYRYDLDRASWAIETILEAQVKDGAREGADVPPQWIEGATHGLFARSDARSDDHTSMEALGTLLNFAAEAELGPGGTKLKLTKRGIGELRKQGYLDGE